jgi:hypothetical protein
MSLIVLAARLAADDPPADVPPEPEPETEAAPEPELETPEDTSEEMFPEQFDGVLEPLDAIKYVARFGIRSSEWAEAALYNLVLDILGGMRTDKVTLDRALDDAANN